MSSKNNKKKKKSQAPKTSAQAQKPKAATEEVDEKNIPVQSLSEMLAFAHEAEADLDKAEENEIDIIVPTKKPEEKAEAKPAEAPKAEAKPQQPKTEAKPAEAPKAEAKPQQPKAETKPAEAPKAEAKPQQPKTEAKPAEAPKAEEPKTETKPVSGPPISAEEAARQAASEDALDRDLETPAVRSSRKKHISSISARWS